MVNPNEIKNKEVRALMYQKLRREKDKTKKKTRLENKDKPKQVPKTIENCRVTDETFIKDVLDDAELQHDLNTDEISRHFKKRAAKKSDPIDDDDDLVADSKKTTKDEDGQNDEEDSEEVANQKSRDKEEFENGETADNQEEVQVDEDEDDEEEEENTDPKILITTTELKISLRTYKLCRELSRVLPNAQYFYRKNVRLTKVIPEAIKRGYSAIMVINENRKEPNGMMVTLLPEGPTLNFKLSSLKTSDEIKRGGGFTKHKPEIMLNNFNTRLGLQIGRSMAALFPPDPQYEGRHCITFHNQRDYIFFRHHRYLFKSAQKVGLQELGPRFTLRLRSLQKGQFNPKFGEYEYVHKRHAAESNRRKFTL